MGLYDYTVYSVIKRNAAIHREKVALICGEEKITHEQFLDRVDRLACGLLNSGVKKGDRIAVVAHNSAEFVYIYGASAKVGAVMTPINWRLTPEEIEFVVSDVSPRIMFVGSDFQALTEPLIAKFDCIERCHSMAKAEGKFAAFDDLMRNDGDCRFEDVSSDDAYLILHTAAVAGRPRGATMSHRSLLMCNLQNLVCWNLEPEDTNLNMLPLFHVAGLGFCLMVTQVGGTNVILPRFDPDLALKSIQEHKVTLFVEFPPMLSTLLERNEELKYDLSTLRMAGGLEAPETAGRFQETTGATFWTAYGQSETSGIVCLAPYFDRPGSAGRPCSMTEMRIVDDHGNIVETGKTGEIVVRGPVVFKGYWNLEKDNEHTFRDGWHHTGDMGRFDEDGYLWYSGRAPEKELIKPGGENVYPAEVEKVILEHQSIEEVSVIGVPDEQWGEAIKAVCVLKKGESLLEAELIEFVASRIARFKKPKHVVFVSELPKTDGGSVDRAEVKATHGKI